MINNILLVDDHEIFLDGLQSVIHEKNHLRVKATAPSAAKALQLLAEQPFDIMVTDYAMPDMDGLELVQRARHIAPDLRVIVLSMVEDREEVRSMLTSGVDAYVLKKYARQELFGAIEAVISGENYWSSEVCRAVIEGHRENANPPVLTLREREVLKLLAQELTNREVADRLYISERTVESHRKNIMRKIGTGSIVGLVRYAFAHKML